MIGLLEMEEAIDKVLVETSDESLAWKLERAKRLYETYRRETTRRSRLKNAENLNAMRKLSGARRQTAKRSPGKDSELFAKR